MGGWVERRIRTYLEHPLDHVPHRLGVRIHEFLGHVRVQCIGLGRAVVHPLILEITGARPPHQGRHSLGDLVRAPRALRGHGLRPFGVQELAPIVGRWVGGWIRRLFVRALGWVGGWVMMGNVGG